MGLRGSTNDQDRIKYNARALNKRGAKQRQVNRRNKRFIDLNTVTTCKENRRIHSAKYCVLTTQTETQRRPKKKNP